MKKIDIYCDGGCKGTKKGGYAFVVLENENILYEESEVFEDTTNNQMEILSIIKALKSLVYKNLQNEKINLYSDSQYCVQGINEWIKNWKKNGWLTGKKEPVKNRDLWINLDTYVEMFKDLNISWVKGHQDSKWNIYVDELYNKTIKGEEYKPKKVKVKFNNLALELLEDCLYLIDELPNTSLNTYKHAKDSNTLYKLINNYLTK